MVCFYSIDFREHEKRIRRWRITLFVAVLLVILLGGAEYGKRYYRSEVKDNPQLSSKISLYCLLLKDVVQINVLWKESCSRYEALRLYLQRDDGILPTESIDFLIAFYMGHRAAVAAQSEIAVRYKPLSLKFEQSEGVTLTGEVSLPDQDKEEFCARVQQELTTIMHQAVADSISTNIVDGSVLQWDKSDLRESVRSRQITLKLTPKKNTPILPPVSPALADVITKAMGWHKKIWNSTLTVNWEDNTKTKKVSEAVDNNLLAFKLTAEQLDVLKAHEAVEVSPLYYLEKAQRLAGVSDLSGAKPFVESWTKMAGAQWFRSRELDNACLKQDIKDVSALRLPRKEFFEKITNDLHRIEGALRGGVKRKHIEKEKTFATSILSQGAFSQVNGKVMYPGLTGPIEFEEMKGELTFPRWSVDFDGKGYGNSKQERTSPLLTLGEIGSMVADFNASEQGAWVSGIEFKFGGNTNTLDSTWNSLRLIKLIGRVPCANDEMVK